VFDGPAVHPQPCLEAQVRDGQIEVRKFTDHATARLASNIEDSRSATIASSSQGKLRDSQRKMNARNQS
jgi:hypothetical protein